MPQDYASSLKFGLQDLMAGNGGGYAPPPQAPQVPGSPDPLETQRAALLAQLMQPDQTVPDKEAPKRNMLASILMGLGDAGTAYASVIGNAPGIKTDTLGNYMAFLAQQKDSAEKFNERKKLGDAESKRRNLVIGLNELDTKQARADAAAAKKEMLAYRTAQDQQHAAEVANAGVQAKALNDADNATRISIEKMGNAARARSDGLQADLHRLRATGEADKDQHAEYAKSRQFIVGKKAEWAQMLAEGKATPEQIIAQWQDTLDASDLSGKYREAADAFFQDKIGTLLMQYAPQQGPAPQPYGATGPIPQGQIDAARQAAREGPKY